MAKAGVQKKGNALVQSMSGGQTQVEWIFFVLGVVMTMAGVSVLVGLSQTTVIPFYEDKMYEYAETTCNVTSRAIAVDNKCVCDVKRRDSLEYDCNVAEYPCVQVKVTYMQDKELGPTGELVKSEVSQFRVGMLYNDIPTIKRFHNELYECSFYICQKNKQDNLEAVNVFRYQIENRTVCYYNTREPKLVVINLTTQNAVLHTILWPSLVLSTGVILFMSGVIMFYRNLRAAPLEKVVDEEELKRRRRGKEAEEDEIIKICLDTIHKERLDRQSPIVSRQHSRQLGAVTDFLNSLPDSRFRYGSEKGRAPDTLSQQSSIKKKDDKRRASDGDKVAKFFRDQDIFSQPGVRLVGGRIVLRC